jgi:ABC-type branched-subunit amino acid transport system ATPase component
MRSSGADASRRPIASICCSPPDSNGRDLLAVPPAERAHLGIAHVPEGRQVFASMTVMENLDMGAYTGNGRARRDRKELQDHRQKLGCS